ALEDTGDAAEVRLFETRAQAQAAMVRGSRRLLLRVPTGLRSIADRLPNQRKLALSRSPYASIGALLDDCEACAADQMITDAGGPAWDAEGFARLVTKARPALPLATSRALYLPGQVLDAAARAAPGCRRPGGALDDRGAASQPVRPGARHLGPDLGEADPGRAGPARRPALSHCAKPARVAPAREPARSEPLRNALSCIF